MTKADLVNRIAEKTGIEKNDVQAVVELWSKEMKFFSAALGVSSLKKELKKPEGIYPSKKRLPFQPTIFRPLNQPKYFWKL
jgi:hypothetical protein